MTNHIHFGGSDTRAVAVRHANEFDTDFLTSSWLRSFRENGFLSKSVPNRIYYDQHHKVLEQLLPRSATVVACWADAPSEILGYMTFEVMDKHLVIHFVYVKEGSRKKGIATRLLAYVLGNKALDLHKGRIILSHQTFDGKAITTGSRDKDPWWKRHPEMPIEWLYNPYMLFYSLEKGWESK